VDLEFAEEALAVGTLYKDMKLKPNILLEYTKERFVDSDIPDLPEDVNTFRHRTSDKDLMFLEDETGRTKLVFDDEEKQKQLTGELVTGIIMACLGQEDHNGNFNVKQYFFHDFPKQSPYPSIGMLTN
jgi:DNA polymerase delta subunit 2